MTNDSAVPAGATMPLLRVHGAGDMRVDSVPVPAVGPGDVLVRVAAVGVCGTDLSAVAIGGLGGGTTLDAPLPLGHEFAGVVERVGDQVKDIRPGQRCAVNPDRGVIGCGGPTGAFAPFILIPDARLGADICPVPDDLPLERAALAEPLSVALHGVNIASPGPGAKVVVLGAGPIGLCAVVCLRRLGLTDIVVADLSDARLERAKALGASATINPSRESLAGRIGEIQGAGTRFGIPFVETDCFLDAAGSGPALEAVLDVAKYRAKIVVIAIHKKKLPLDLWKMMANEFSIAGSIAADRADEFNECLAVLADPALDLSPLLSHRFPFAQVEEAFRVASDVDASAKVMVALSDAA